MNSIQTIIFSKQSEFVHSLHINMDKKGMELITKLVYEKTMEFISNSLNSGKKLDATDLFRELPPKEQILILNALNK